MVQLDVVTLEYSICSAGWAEDRIAIIEEAGERTNPQVEETFASFLLEVSKA